MFSVGIVYVHAMRRDKENALNAMLHLEQMIIIGFIWGHKLIENQVTANGLLIRWNRRLPICLVFLFGAVC